MRDLCFLRLIYSSHFFKRKCDSLVKEKNEGNEIRKKVKNLEWIKKKEKRICTLQGPYMHVYFLWCVHYIKIFLFMSFFHFCVLNSVLWKFLRFFLDVKFDIFPPWNYENNKILVLHVLSRLQVVQIKKKSFDIC